MATTIERIDLGCASNPMLVLISLTAALNGRVLQLQSTGYRGWWWDRLSNPLGGIGDGGWSQDQMPINLTAACIVKNEIASTSYV